MNIEELQKMLHSAKTDEKRAAIQKRINELNELQVIPPPVKVETIQELNEPPVVSFVPVKKEPVKVKTRTEPLTADERIRLKSEIFARPNQEDAQRFYDNYFEYICQNPNNYFPLFDTKE